MTKQAALRGVENYVASGTFQDDMMRRVSYRTVSSSANCAEPIRSYLQEELTPAFADGGFTVRTEPNRVSSDHPFMIAERIEDPGLPTVLLYGHADVQPALADQWSGGRDPWRLSVEGDRWYGRGTADNKGQHTVNIAALLQVIAARRGHIGYNVRFLIDTSEEIGSPGLDDLCERSRDAIAGSVFIGSDGPRLSLDTPTIFLGSRGSLDFVMSVDLHRGAVHSGNFGGITRNPLTRLMAAVSTMVGPDGRILFDRFRPGDVPSSVTAALSDLHVNFSDDLPVADETWGDAGVSTAQKLFGANSFGPLAMGPGFPDELTSAIPGSAWCQCELRFIPETDTDGIVASIRDHLDRSGFGDVQIEVRHHIPATRLDPGNAWVSWMTRSAEDATGKRVALLPNLAGSLPNHPFSAVLNLPTLWIPHSYPGCAQHAPDEHLVVPLMAESLKLMTAIFWDLGDPSLAAPWNG